MHTVKGAGILGTDDTQKLLYKHNTLCRLPDKPNNHFYCDFCILVNYTNIYRAPAVCPALCNNPHCRNEWARGLRLYGKPVDNEENTAQLACLASGQEHNREGSCSVWEAPLPAEGRPGSAERGAQTGKHLQEAGIRSVCCPEGQVIWCGWIESLPRWEEPVLWFAIESQLQC